jgi:uncharacterized protein YkwD
MKEDKEGKKLLRIEKIPKKTVNKSSDEKKFVDKIKDFGKTTVKFLSWIKKQILSINFVSPSLSKLKKFINSYKKQFNVIILISSIFLFIFSIISLTANLDYLFGKQQSKIRYIEEDGIKYIGIKDGYITEKLIVEAGEKLPSVSDYFSPNYQLDQKHSITYYLGESSIPTETFSVKGEDGSLYVIGSNNTLIVKINNFDEEYTTNLLIRDSTAPTIQLDPVTITQGETVEPLAFVAIFIDNSRSFDFTAELITEGTYDVPGTYEVEVKVCDISNNCAKDKTNLIVEKKPSSGNGGGNKKPNTGTTNPSSGSSTDNGGSSGGGNTGGGDPGNVTPPGGGTPGGGNTGGSNNNGNSKIPTAAVRQDKGVHTYSNYNLTINYYGTTVTTKYDNVTFRLYDDGYADVISYTGKGYDYWNYNGFSSNATNMSYMKRDAISAFISNDYLYSNLQNTFLNGSNTERTKVGATRLTLDHDLNIIAQIRCYEIVYGDNLSHVRPNGTGIKALITTEYGYNPGKASNGSKYFGENIAYGHSSPESAIASLINSSGHYANIVHPSFRRMGVGALYDRANERWIRVQIFTS